MFSKLAIQSRFANLHDILTTENTDPTESMDKSDALDCGGPGRVGETGPNRSETEPIDTSDTLCCGGMGRGEVGWEPASVKSKPVEETTSEQNQKRKLINSEKLSPACRMVDEKLDISVYKHSGILQCTRLITESELALQAYDDSPRCHVGFG